ncbi:hypothetical protein CMMCAS04_14105 [Clavibacter michiganensis subsp. michiganensis]|nr:hypothetical protein CMMCAS04_14105 [Clavibacter michiganensis subsp. michiganensis]
MPGVAVGVGAGVVGAGVGVGVLAAGTWSSALVSDFVA